MLHKIEVRQKMAEFQVGDVVMHKELGRGVIRSIEKDLIEIDFNGEVKQLNFDVLVKNNLIDKYE